VGGPGEAGGARQGQGKIGFRLAYRIWFVHGVTGCGRRESGVSPRVRALQIHRARHGTSTETQSLYRRLCSARRLPFHFFETRPLMRERPVFTRGKSDVRKVNENNTDTRWRQTRCPYACLLSMAVVTVPYASSRAKKYRANLIARLECLQTS
jgi:hypothetical protein